MVAETWPSFVGTNIFDENGSGRESGEKKPLPEVLASQQPLVRRFPHSMNTPQISMPGIGMQNGVVRRSCLQETYPTKSDEAG